MRVFCKYGQDVAEVHIDEKDLPIWRAYTWYADTSQTPAYIKATTRIDGRKTTVYLHRVITNCPSNLKVDHVDREVWNNRRKNLRITHHQRNLANRAGWGASGFKGVSIIHAKKFRVRFLGEHVGYFDTAEAAARAFDEVAEAAFGEFAYLNFPPEEKPETVDHDIPF